MQKSLKIWLRSLFAAVISGFGGGIVTGFAAVGMFPDKFNLAVGLHSTLKLAAASALIHAILGVGMFLQSSPLPKDEDEPEK